MALGLAFRDVPIQGRGEIRGGCPRERHHTCDSAIIRWDAVGLLKRTAVKLAVRDEAREHWGPSQVTDTSQKRHGFNYNKVTLFVPDPVSHHR